MEKLSSIRTADRSQVRLAEAYVAFARRHTVWLLLLAAVLCFSAALPLRQLALSTDIAELLPANAPAVAALRRVSARQRSASNLIILVHSPDAASNERFARALLPHLQQMVPSAFTEIVTRPSSELSDFAQRWRWLYADLDDLDAVKRLLDRLILRRSMPLWVDLERDPEEELRAIKQRHDQKTPPPGPTPTAAREFFSEQEGGTHYLGLLLWRRREGFATKQDREIVQAVQQAVAGVKPTVFHPGMQVEYTGHIAAALDEQGGFRQELTMASLLCLVLVMIVLYAHFRRLTFVAIVAVPALVGVLLSLSLAAYVLHSLNMNTAFLITIILGNGINTPIIILSRYLDECRQAGSASASSMGVGTALGRALVSSFRGTLLAAAAATVAYGCLILTDFRGLNQFGFLGGIGMLLAWATSMLLMPLLLCAVERLRPLPLKHRPSWWQPLFSILGRTVGRHPRLAAACFLALLMPGIPSLLRYARDPIEWDLNNLRTEATPSAGLWGRAASLGMTDPAAGYIGAHAQLLVDRPEQADAIASLIRTKDAARGPAHVLRRVRTLNSLLPEQQAEKLTILTRIRETLDRERRWLSDDEWTRVSTWRPPESLRPVTVDDLPPVLLRAFSEVDGTCGRLILIDVDYETYNESDGKSLLRLAESLTARSDGQLWMAASASTLFGSMLETILRDGPRLSLAAVVGVTLLMLLGFGLRGAVPVLTTVMIGLVALGIFASARGVKINFMNFVALPITLGVGADYASNLWARMRQEDSADASLIIAQSGASVALCSATTVIGYGSLLLSRNLALRSFGMLAGIGEVTCLLTALILLPALNAQYRRWTHPALPTQAPR